MLTCSRTHIFDARVKKVCAVGGSPDVFVKFLFLDFAVNMFTVLHQHFFKILTVSSTRKFLQMD